MGSHVRLDQGHQRLVLGVVELDYAGRGDDGNMFMFDGTGWVFNLSTKGLAPGKYTISAVPGGAYAIDPACEMVVTIQ